MSSYLVNKESHGNGVLNLTDIEGYTFRPKLDEDSLVKVSAVTVVDKFMLDRILSIKFDRSFKRVVNMALNVINDDDATDDGAEIVLNQVELVREILLNRYQKFLSHEKEILFLKKLRLIENELRLKQVRIKRKAMYLASLEEQEKSHGRAR